MWASLGGNSISVPFRLQLFVCDAHIMETSVLLVRHDGWVGGILDILDCIFPFVVLAMPVFPLYAGDVLSLVVVCSLLLLHLVLDAA